MALRLCARILIGFCLVLFIFKYLANISSGDLEYGHDNVLTRIVAIGKLKTHGFNQGDIHGDLPSALKVLEFAGILNEKRDWIAGRTILVQTVSSK